MPTPTQTQRRMNQRDTQLLIEFLRTLEQVLHVTITTDGLFIPLQFRETFLAGWRDVRPSIRPLMAAIRSHKYDAKLHANGLTGSQLAMKMAVYQDALENLQAFFSQHVPARSAAPERASAPPRKETIGQKVRKRGRQLLQYFFKPANVVLGSLTKAIPLAELLHELKGTVETALDHADLHEAIDKENAAKATEKEWAQWTQAAIALAALVFTVTKQRPPAKT